MFGPIVEEMKWLRTPILRGRFNVNWGVVGKGSFRAFEGLSGPLVNPFFIEKHSVNLAFTSAIGPIAGE